LSLQPPEAEPKPGTWELEEATRPRGSKAAVWQGVFSGVGGGGAVAGSGDEAERVWGTAWTGGRARSGVGDCCTVVYIYETR